MVKSLEYSNKYKKEEAYQKMVMLAKTVHEESNVESVKSKIYAIRGCVRKEMKNVMASKRYSSSNIPDDNEESAASEPIGNDTENVQLPVEEKRITTQ
ncbi:hypothetical protein PR048_008328, partial [Dryococelus australis]